jgi:DNA-binding CsgD family transcriptional regulator
VPWVLIRPLASPVFHDGSGIHVVDPLISGQITQLPIPGNDAVTCALDSPWRAKLLDLLTYQFRDVATTKATMMVWAKTELVAVFGIASTNLLKDEARQVANEAAYCLQRIHEHESLRQEVGAHRHLSMDRGQPLVIVHADGQIAMATETGWDTLQQFLRRRTSKKDPLVRLPTTMMATLSKTGKSTMGKMAIHVYRLPGEFEILSPLRAVFLEPTHKVSALTFSQRIETLTTSQRAAYNLVVAGLRNKEIACEMGISYNTAIHHVASMLSRMECGDRLQLMAMAAQAMPRKILMAPTMTAAQVMPDLPRPASKVAT